ncbi:class I SAM-dependent methyltransferase [Mesorhizobium sp. VK4C]|uniref:class I SAM-dependent methyltransferase n=1 Tax=Mesorhizobium captivum TaxID=3072319 RepID=UPI002A24DFAB|nr:class I SAM-dependent methyltransferase [Mesorhizobium sp. VK4C]MDX8503128.1 class I SAM-dependent methyltransferase [Mesorhizobium sp. VK4C]
MLRDNTTANQDQIPKSWDDYDGLDYYYQYRPEYPPALAERLRVRLEGSTGGTVIDVGSGTGLFTHSVATALGPGYHIMALEPNEGMRRYAASRTPPGMLITYVDGIAENIPVADQSVQLLTAASAVYRFDRPVFYQEAERVLILGGVLALIQYDPFDRGSPFNRDFLSTIERSLPSDRRHWHSEQEGGYSETDLSGEIKSRSAFRNVERELFVHHEQIDLKTFMFRTLSFTMVQKAMQATGRSQVMERLFDTFDRHADQNRLVAMPYEAEMITARRAIKDCSADDL